VNDDLDVIRQLAAYRPIESDLESVFPAARREVLLHRSMAPSPAQGAPVRHRRTARAGWIAAGVVVVTAALIILQVVLPGGTTGGSPRASAAVLELLATKAGAAPADILRPGQFRYLVETDVEGGSKRVLESWTSSDGHIWRRDSQGDAVRYYQFPPAPLFGVGAPTLSPQGLDPITTDPASLNRYLRAHVHGSNTPDEAVFVASGDIVRTGFAPPALRAAAIRVLESTPHVQAVATNDADGKPSVKVTYDDPAFGHAPQSLFFDPATSVLLEQTDGCCAYQGLFSGAGVVNAVPEAVLQGALRLPTPLPPEAGAASAAAHT
jgi:hypothetical protein